jgi:hypothetical protein
MGMYVNPHGQPKEAWLYEHAEEIRDDPPAEFFPSSPYAWVCLVQNPAFSAAAVAYNKLELERFSNPADLRPKTWFQVLKEDLLSVIPEFEHQYLE